MPQEVKNLVNDLNYQTGVSVGKELTIGEFAKQPTQTEFTTADGHIWKFKGYNALKTNDFPGDVENLRTVVFQGEWDLITENVDVTREFVSVTEGKVLPQKLKNLAFELKDRIVVSVDEKITTGLAKEPKTKEFSVKGGVWKFKEYVLADIYPAYEEAPKTAFFQGKWEFFAREDQPQPELTRWVDENGNLIPGTAVVNGAKGKDDNENSYLQKEENNCR